MYVKDYMHTRLITVNPHNLARVAHQLMHTHKIRHLPVVDQERRLVGVVTDRDVRKAGASDDLRMAEYELDYLLEKMTIQDMMTAAVVTVRGETPIHEAGKIFIEKKFGCLPVVDASQVLQGIITVTDLLRAYVAQDQAGARLLQNPTGSAGSA